MRMRNSVVKTLFAVVICFIFMAVCTNKNQAIAEDGSLWPEIEPFDTGHLKVSDLHEIYYELCGNPNGKPVFVLHGGPGARISPYYRRFFNPEVYLIVLHDQRGCGQSRPLFELRENTSYHLVEDIESLRKHLKLDKIILFGGSWGSTLGLAYAETYPDNTAAMVLRGIFTAAQDEMDHFYRGGVRPFFPEIYEKLEQAFGKNPTPQTIYDKIKSEDPAERRKYSRAWSGYELKLGNLHFPDEWLKNFLTSKEYAALVVSLALIENYYMANGCFFEQGQLLRDTDKIKDIRTILVNGRYDMICPPINAYRLHKRLNNSKLVIAEESGHSMDERNIEQALVRAMREFE
jgi:proline iminopeptidase